MTAPSKTRAQRPERRRAATRLLATCLGLAFMTAPLPALAQQRPTLTVIIVDRVGFTDEEIFELQYGIEQIVTDFDEFDLLSAIDRDAALDSDDRYGLEGCALDVDCYADILGPQGVDVAVVLEAEPASEGNTAYTTGLDLRGRQILSEHEGNFPEPGDSLYLLAPMFETMEPLTAVGGGEVAEEGPDERRVVEPYVPPPTTDGDGVNVLATSLIAGGGAVTLTGIIFWIMADNTQEQIQREPHDRPELEDLQSRGETQGTIGNVAFFTGLAVAITGIVFQLTGIGAPKDDFGFDDDDDWVRLDLRPGASPYVGIEMDF